MSSTRTKRSRNRGTVNSSTVGDPTCRKTSKKFSGQNEKKISKYFAPAKKDNDLDNSDELSDSPYKNCLSEVKSVKLNNSSSDFDDFVTPKAINKVSKIVSKPAERQTRKKKTRQLPLRKFVEDNLKYSDVNPEHLQMALVLSESSYQAENPNATPSSQEKKKSFKLAFEKFGFGYSKSRVSVENRREVTDCNKLHKKSRYRFITPILKIRTDEEREALISSKVSLILAQNNRKPIGNNVQEPRELFCETLQKIRVHRIFKYNCLDLSELENEAVFYVWGLGIESSPALCGCLLKDWRTIPGRARSPEPSLTPPTSYSPARVEVNSPSLENLASTSKERRISNSTIDFSCSEISMHNNTSKCDEDPSLTPPTSHSLAGVESPKISSPSLENLVSTSKKRWTSSSTINLSYNEINIADNSSKCGEPSLTPPTSLSPAWMEFPNINSPSLENLPSTSKKHRISSATVDLSCSEINILDNSSQWGEDRTREKLNPEITSPVVEKLSPTCEDTINLQCDVSSVSSRAMNTSEPIIIDSHETDKYEQLSKYRLSPEVISPEHETSTDEVLHASMNLTEIYTVSCGTPKCGNKLLLSPTTTELLKRSLSPAINSPRLETLSTKSSRNSAPFTPPQRNKRPHDCLSPDLFDSDDEQPPSRLRGGQDFNLEEIECYDLTQSDSEEEKSFHLKLSDAEDSIGRRSDLNVTEYVQNLLSNYKEEATPIKKLEKISTSEDESQQSQSSVYISDDELNYSSVFSTPPKCRKKVYYDLSEDEEFGVSLADRIKNKYKEDFPLCKENAVDLCDQASSSHESSILPPPEVSLSDRPPRLPLTNLRTDNVSHTPNKPSHALTTPTLEDFYKPVFSQIPLNDTPSTSNTSVVIKTKNVTPMANYDEMDTPKISKELDKYGLKPLKRQKGAKLLKYIYESTHPVVGDENHCAKKRRTQYPHYGGIIGDVGEEGEVILERKQSKKFATCAIPLHIVWHNFVASNPNIRESILLYEPLQLEVLHSMLKDQGFKFNIQDLLAFMDKKCITIRTAQGQHHGKNRR